MFYIYKKADRADMWQFHMMKLDRAEADAIGAQLQAQGFIVTIEEQQL